MKNQPIESSLDVLFTLNHADGTVETHPIQNLRGAVIVIRTKAGETKAAGFGDMDEVLKLTKNVPEVLKSIEEQIEKSL